MKGTARKVETLIDLSLKDSELRYRRLFEAAQDGILILDAETGAITDVNPFLIDMLGYSREEFVRKKLWEVDDIRSDPRSNSRNSPSGGCKPSPADGCGWGCLYYN